MLRTYKEKKFRLDSLRLIEHANQIIAEYQSAGYTLTLRQLYYQFVSRDLIANKQTEYSRLGSIINDGRLAGYIDWHAIEDRTRNMRTVNTWDHPSEVLEACAQQFKINLWDNQPIYCEVWVEKDALIGVIEPVCNKLRVPYFACRGYTSQSEQWGAGQRFVDRIERGQGVVVLHLGDHDPSGIDMTRDNEDRLRMFIGADVDDKCFRIERLALNMAQVRRYNPPPNPAKMTDSRFESYMVTHGDKSWELDALDPTVIGNLIEKEILILRDDEVWDVDSAKEDRYRGKLRDLVDNTNFGDEET